MNNAMELINLVIEGRRHYTFSLYELHELNKLNNKPKDFNDKVMLLLILGYVQFNDVLKKDDRPFSKMVSIVKELSEDAETSLAIHALTSIPNKELYAFLKNQSSLGEIDCPTLISIYNVSYTTILSTIKLLGGYTCAIKPYQNLMIECSFEITGMRQAHNLVKTGKIQ